MEKVLEEWRRFVAAQPTQGEVKPFVVASWERSRAAGVPPAPHLPEFFKVAPDELRRRLDASRDLIALARPHLAWLSAVMGEVAHVAYLTDADGIVLHSAGDPEAMQALGLAPGYDWSEARMGTNGAGTALACDRPVAIVGPEHYSSPFHDFICTGAPIHAPDGRLVGALDLSTSVADGSPSRLALVAHIAFTVETLLARRLAESETRRATRLLAVLAHELRNPLTPILHYLESVDRLDAEPAQRRQLYGRMRVQVQRALRLVDDLTDLARATGGKLELRGTDLDLRTAVQHALESVACSCDGRGVRLCTQFAAAPVAVHGDVARLAQIAANLLANACKFTPAGGEVHLSVQAEDGAAVLRVRDTGIGIEPQALGEIFRPFVQADSGTTNGGLGLGLAVVADLVRMHGGEVTAHSAGRGRGSEFTVRLPLAGSSHVEPVAPTPPSLFAN